MNTRENRSFVTGAAVLGIAGILSKVIGLFIRIPLLNIIGEEGMGLYSKAFPIYSWLLVLSSAGLPSAVAKMVAERRSVGDIQGIKSVFRSSMSLLMVLGMICSVAMGVLYKKIAIWMGDPLSAMCMLAIAPAIFFVSVISAYRGFFQGMNDMRPTGISQVVEQIVKLMVGVFMAYKLYPLGIEYGAAGAIFGVTASEFVALLMLMFWHKKVSRREGEAKASAKVSAKGTIRQLLSLSIPIMLGASVMPLASVIDSAMVTNRLLDIGYSIELARALYGILTTAVNTLINVPAAVSLAISMSLIPVISAAWAKGDITTGQKNAKMGFKSAILIGFPSCAALIILAKPILTLLYSSGMSPERIDIAAKILQVTAPSCIVLALVQAMTGILQGRGFVHVPVIGLAIGAAVKIVFTYVLVGVPAINIYGATLGTIACYTIAAAIDIVKVFKTCKLRISFVADILKPTVATLIMSAVIFGVVRFGTGIFGRRLVALVAACVGLAVYAVALPLTEALTYSEALMLPGGRKIAKLYEKLGLKSKHSR